MKDKKMDSKKDMGYSKKQDMKDDKNMMDKSMSREDRKCDVMKQIKTKSYKK